MTGLLYLFFILNEVHSYKKEEKLKSRTLINHLFNQGKSLSFFPLKVLYDFVENNGKHLQAGVTVSSRNFKKAVDRNRIKRVTRESYRLQKSSLETMLIQKKLSLILFFIYTNKDMSDFQLVHGKMHLLLQKMEDIINRLPEK